MSLTKHPIGSLKELISIAFPLMLSSLSVMTMIFADRWLLAHYSVEAHNAAVTATTTGWSFILGWVVLGNISEVFVAQYNGAGLKNRLGEPIWQMIWLSLASVAFFWPLAYWGPSIFFDTEMEKGYFQTMMFFGPFYPIYASLCGFFIGQAKTKMVTLLVVAANIVNILFDWILIFGVEGWIEPMGVQGAAIATSLATLFQAVVLGISFLNRQNRQNHGTNLWKLKINILFDCIKVGLPSAIFSVFQVFAFAVYYSLMRDMGPNYITVAGICQAVFLLFFFFAEGLNKGTATIVGNLIGAKQTEHVPKVIRSGLKLNFIFFGILLFAFFTLKSVVIQGFLPYAEPAFVESIRGTLEICLLLVVIENLFEGIKYQFAAILIASGDTFFMLVSGTAVVWLCMVLPVYYFVALQEGPMELALVICVAYSIIGSLIYYLRISTGKWSTLSISSEVEKSRNLA